MFKNIWNHYIEMKNGHVEVNQNLVKFLIQWLKLCRVWSKLKIWLKELSVSNLRYMPRDLNSKGNGNRCTEREKNLDRFRLASHWTSFPSPWGSSNMKSSIELVADRWEFQFGFFLLNYFVPKTNSLGPDWSQDFHSHLTAWCFFHHHSSAMLKQPPCQNLPFG